VRISWEHGTPCDTGSRALTVTVEVEDADTPVSNLSYDGPVGGCDPRIDAAMSTLDCSGSQPSVGFVTVTDPEGNSDQEGFTVLYCEDGGQSF
jgi:hypothetical protein